MSAQGRVVDYRSSTEPGLAHPAEKVVGFTLEEILPGRFGGDAMQLLGEALASGEPRSRLVEIPMDSLVRELEVRVVPNGPDEALFVLRDVTDRRRLEKEILEISHREQQRIGQDLHDSLGQHLTGISFLSKALQLSLERKALPESAQAGEIAQLVVQTLGHTRNIARGLFPMELETSGLLIPALTELVTTTEKIFRVVCSIDAQPGFDVRHPRVSTELFRITQEAISNAIKHGKARKISVRLQSLGTSARLTIHDNGVGVPSAGKSGGLGLRIMSFRASRIGGQLGTSTSETGGTVVTCDFPIPAPEEAAPRSP